MQPHVLRRRHTQAPQMEGLIARWYAGVRGTESQLADWRRQAAQISAELPEGGKVLEIAPGPGYLSVELAMLGRVHVSAVDMSHSFVQMVSDRARRARVVVDVRWGDAARVPFPSDTFDRIVCQAAFKNFGEPVAALNEMHRVLRAGGVAVIQDMNRRATGADIGAEVRRMRLGGIHALMTRVTLGGLRRRAYTSADFERMAVESAFGGCDIRTDGIGVDVRLHRR